jgi:hypothetical protein
VFRSALGTLPDQGLEFHADAGGRIFQKSHVAKAAVVLKDQNNSTIMEQILLVLVGAACISASGQKYDQLALTPPMGWNS